MRSESASAFFDKRQFMKDDMKARFMAWIKKEQVWGFFVSMVVMAVVSVAFFAPNNFDGDTLQQHDMQQGMANGEEGRAYAEATGEKALWTNALFSGMPTFQISPEYPSNSLFTWLNDVYGLWLPAPSNLLFMMMMGMLIMCYCLKMRWWYALIAALSWGLSSYFVIIIGAGHIWKFMALTYVPPTVGAMMLAYRRRPLAGAAMMGLFTMLELNANHPQITYYSLFLMAFLVIGYLVSAIRDKRMKQWLKVSGLCLLAGVLAVGANSPSLYNTYEYSKETKRAASELTNGSGNKSTDADERPTGGLPKAEIGGWSNTPGESLSLLVPNIKGGASIRPVKGQNTMLGVTELPEYNYDMQANDMFGLMQQFPQYFGGKGITNGPFYVGALIFALFLLGCIIVKGSEKWALLAATVLSVCLAMGNHFEALTDFMIYNFPLYNKFRAAETALVIAALCMPLLGIMALQQVFSAGAEERRRYRVPVLIAFGVPVVIAFTVWVAPGVFGAGFSSEELEYFDQARAQLSQYPVDVQEAFKATLDNIETLRYGLVSADGARSLFVLVLGLVCVWAVLAGKVRAWAGCIGVGAICVFDLYGVDKRYIDTESFVAADTAGAVAAPEPDTVDREILGDKGYYRVADLTAMGDARRSYFHHMVGGYHAAKLGRYNDLMERRMQTAIGVGAYMPEVYDDSLVAGAQDRDRAVMKNLRADYNVLSMLNTRYIIGRDGLQTNPRAMGPGWLVGGLEYVDGADAEMAALASLDPAQEAVADSRFRGVLGEEQPSLAPGDTVMLEKYTPNSLTYKVSTKAGGLAVFSEIWFPWGWKASVDGTPVQLGRVNYVLRAMRVPAGEHTVTMTFDPDSLRVTGTIAYICVTFIYLLLLLAVFSDYIGAAVRRKHGH